MELHTNIGWGIAVITYQYFRIKGALEGSWHSAQWQLVCLQAIPWKIRCGSKLSSTRYMEHNKTSTWRHYAKSIRLSFLGDGVCALFIFSDIRVCDDGTFSRCIYIESIEALDFVRIKDNPQFLKAWHGSASIQKGGVRLFGFIMSQKDQHDCEKFDRIQVLGGIFWGVSEEKWFFNIFVGIKQNVEN